MTFLNNLAFKLKESLRFCFHDKEAYIVNYGYVVLICVLFFYFTNLFFLNPNVSESFFLRITSVLVALPLALKNRWPSSLKPWLQTYWYFAIIYTLPFFFTYMLLQNSQSYIWHINGLTGFMFLALFCDWISFLFLSCIGIIGGLMTYAFFKPEGASLIPPEIPLVFFNYIAPIIFLMAFSGKNNRIQEEKIKTMKILAGAIAHEMRTPLCGISATTFGLRKMFPNLLKAYLIARENNLLENDPLDSQDLENLKEIPDNLEKTTGSILTTISILLMNLKENPLDTEPEICSIKNCIKDAIRESHLTTKEVALIKWEKEEDFIFKGNQVLLKHVFFNLLKNALYYVKAANKGEIIIFVETGHKYNKLHFKDTGQGISQKSLPHIFDKFYTKSAHGTGIGLAFCKMVMEGIGGNIACQSVEGEFTEFVLSFPVIEPQKP